MTITATPVEPGLSCRLKFPGIHLEMMKTFKKLHGAVIALRFEGKPVFRKNLKMFFVSQRKLAAAFRRHKQLEEKAIFPFLEKHIPRLEPVLQLLRKDHAELEFILKSFPSTPKRLEPGNRLKEEAAGKIIGLQHQVDYFWQILKNHIYLEENIVYKNLEKELHSDEIQLLKQLLQDGKNAERDGNHIKISRKRRHSL